MNKLWGVCEHACTIEASLASINDFWSLKSTHRQQLYLRYGGGGRGALLKISATHQKVRGHGKLISLHQCLSHIEYFHCWILSRRHYLFRIIQIVKLSKIYNNILSWQVLKKFDLNLQVRLEFQQKAIAQRWIVNVLKPQMGICLIVFYSNNKIQSFICHTHHIAIAKLRALLISVVKPQAESRTKKIFLSSVVMTIKIRD